VFTAQLLIGSAMVALTVLRAAADEPLPDTRVMLYDDERRLLAASMTEADGQARFRDLGAGRYELEVRRPDRRWRLPLHVTVA